MLPAYHQTLPAIILALVMPGVSALRAEVIISEIMYNPASNERYPNHVEWVEIYNAGEDPVDISGYYLEDEDGKTQPLGDGLVIPPKRALVLVPDGMTPQAFHAAWGEGIPVVALKGWLRPGISGLANTPSDTNEVLTLRSAADELVDEVNFDDERGWPSDKRDGASIYLLPGHLNARDNDLGRHWAASVPATHGAKTNTRTTQFDGQDIGSPGIVATVP